MNRPSCGSAPGSSTSLDFSTTIRWTDARLAPLENCRLPLSRVWHPQFRITNSGMRSPMFGNYVEIGPGGEVTWMNRFQGVISAPHRIDAFPFDRFLIRISGASLVYGADEVRAVVDPHSISREAAFTTAGWRIGEPSARTALGKVAGARPEHSFVHVELEARRDSEFFVWKVILPLVLIVFMSWGVFWIDPSMFGPQIGLSATSMLTLIAFQFAFERMIPRLAYFTRMDEFVLGSSALVFLAFSEAIASTYLVGVDRRANAQRLDRISRWVFPLSFASLLAYAFLR
jgi:hypothetical protein